jgi:hypothetical protein
LAGLGVGKVKTLFRPQRPRRDEKRCIGTSDRIGVDDPHIHPGHALWVEVVVLDRDLGADIEVEPTLEGQESHRAQLVGGVGDGSGQSEPQRGHALRGLEANPTGVDLEAPEAVAHRD